VTLETSFDEKSPQLAGHFSSREENSPKTGWLAGDAVLFAPVSGQVPCKQGIFQGIVEVWHTPILAQKRYIYGVSAQIPYSGLQGILVG